MNIKKNNFFLLFIIFLVFSVKFSFFLNIYIVTKNNAINRLTENYGYCYPMGFGFIHKIKKKYNLINENIEVKNKNVYPTSKIFIYSFNSQKSSKQILINFNIEDLNKIKKKFKILEKEQNCYMIEFQ